MDCTITLAAVCRIVIEQANIVISIEIGELPMIADTTALSQGQDLQASTESAYDATVRADIELFRSYAEKFRAGQLSVDDFRAQRLRCGVYTQRQEGAHMILPKEPGGVLT